MKTLQFSLESSHGKSQITVFCRSGVAFSWLHYLLFTSRVLTTPEGVSRGNTSIIQDLGFKIHELSLLLNWGVQCYIEFGVTGGSCPQRCSGPEKHNHLIWATQLHHTTTAMTQGKVKTDPLLKTLSVTKSLAKLSFINWWIDFPMW